MIIPHLHAYSVAVTPYFFLHIFFLIISFLLFFSTISFPLLLSRFILASSSLLPHLILRLKITANQLHHTSVRPRILGSRQLPKKMKRSEAMGGY